MEETDEIIEEVMADRAKEFKLPDNVAIAFLEKDGVMIPYIGKGVNKNELTTTYRMLKFISDSDIINKNG